MSYRLTKLVIAAACPALLGIAGCGGGPIALKQIEIDPAASGQRAIEAYDKNGDGVLAGEELDQAVSLKSAMSRLDLDQDGQVTAEEVTGLIELATNDVVVITTVKCNVYLDGELLDGAIVTFEPEEFLGAGIPNASGITSKGRADITIAEEQRQDPTARGVHIGLYRVKISKIVGGLETIPAKYNTNTTLGIEVARRASWKPGAARFDLTSN